MLGKADTWPGKREEEHEAWGKMLEASRQEGGERESGKSISKEAPAALHPVLWEWEDCMTWSETPLPASCWLHSQANPCIHRDMEERVKRGSSAFLRVFVAISGPGVTDQQYESVNQTTYHAEDVTWWSSLLPLPGKILSDMHRVSSAGRSWDHSWWDHHPTHSTELSGGAGWLGSWERWKLAITSASKPATCLPCSSVRTIRLQCWAVLLCTGRRHDIALPAETRTSLHSITLTVPMAERGTGTDSQCSPLQLELPHSDKWWGREG